MTINRIQALLIALALALVGVAAARAESPRGVTALSNRPLSGILTHVSALSLPQSE